MSRFSPDTVAAARDGQRLTKGLYERIAAPSLKKRTEGWLSKLGADHKVREKPFPTYSFTLDTKVVVGKSVITLGQALKNRLKFHAESERNYRVAAHYFAGVEDPDIAKDIRITAVDAKTVRGVDQSIYKQCFGFKVGDEWYVTDLPGAPGALRLSAALGVSVGKVTVQVDGQWLALHGAKIRRLIQQYHAKRGVRSKTSMRAHKLVEVMTGGTGAYVPRGKRAVAPAAVGVLNSVSDIHAKAIGSAGFNKLRHPDHFRDESGNPMDLDSMKNYISKYGNRGLRYAKTLRDPRQRKGFGPTGFFVQTDDDGQQSLVETNKYRGMKKSTTLCTGAGFNKESSRIGKFSRRQGKCVSSIGSAKVVSKMPVLSQYYNDREHNELRAAARAREQKALTRVNAKLGKNFQTLSEYFTFLKGRVDARSRAHVILTVANLLTAYEKQIQLGEVNIGGKSVTLSSWELYLIVAGLLLSRADYDGEVNDRDMVIPGGDSGIVASVIDRHRNNPYLATAYEHNNTHGRLPIKDYLVRGEVKPELVRNISNRVMVMQRRAGQAPRMEVDVDALVPLDRRVL